MSEDRFSSQRHPIRSARPHRDDVAQDTSPEDVNSSHCTAAHTCLLATPSGWSKIASMALATQVRSAYLATWDMNADQPIKTQRTRQSKQLLVDDLSPYHARAWSPRPLSEDAYHGVLPQSCARTPWGVNLPSNRATSEPVSIATLRSLHTAQQGQHAADLQH